MAERLLSKAGLKGEGKGALKREGSPGVRIDVPDSASPAVRRFAGRFFDASGKLLGSPEDAVPAVARAIEQFRPATRRRVRLSSEVREWAADRKRRAEREASRRAFEKDLESGKRSCDLVRHPLYDYQRLRRSGAGSSRRAT